MSRNIVGRDWMRRRVELASHGSGGRSGHFGLLMSTVIVGNPGIMDLHSALHVNPATMLGTIITSICVQSLTETILMPVILATMPEYILSSSGEFESRIRTLG